MGEAKDAVPHPQPRLLAIASGEWRGVQGRPTGSDRKHDASAVRAWLTGIPRVHTQHLQWEGMGPRHSQGLDHSSEDFATPRHWTRYSSGQGEGVCASTPT